jgi:pyridoxal phosphate enzyme (YggS family)
MYMLDENIRKIKAQIDEALECRREPMLTGDKVTLVAVSKTQPATAVKEALAAGISLFGENRVQEAAQKIPLVGGGEWHLIGHLQLNKVKKAVSLFDFIYSVDSLNLLLAIDKEAGRLGKCMNVLLQTNIAGEKSKFGIAPEGVPSLAREAAELSHIRLRGLMVIAPEGDAETTRPIFRAGYRLFADLKKEAGLAEIDTLSMGMSGDFAVAVEEGSNNIRLGTVIFGQRSYSI